MSPIRYGRNSPAYQSVYSRQKDSDIFIPGTNPRTSCIEYPDRSLNLAPGSINLPTINLCADYIEYSTPETDEMALTDIVNGLCALKDNSSNYSVIGQCQLPGGDNGGMVPPAPL